LAIFFTIIARLVQGIGGMALLFLISKFLTIEEQGYYFTFGSVVAIQIFFELGLNTIITQFAAHENAKLKWNEFNQISGDKISLSRLSSLLHLCLKIFSILSISLFFILLICGNLFFINFNNGLVNWQIPWILICISNSLMFFLSPILAFLEGIGLVKNVAKARLLQQTSFIFISIIILYFKGGLFVLGLSTFFSFLVLSISILPANYSILKSIYYKKTNWVINYWKEVFPYQYKIGISWISGYFIFQLFNPILFARDGAIVAGQMGMTLAALNGIASLSMSWMSTKIALFSNYISIKDFKKLDILFNKTFFQAAAVNILSIITFLVIMTWLNYTENLILKRFLPLHYIVILIVITFINQIIYYWAVYLRCHKQEPFLYHALLLGILCASSTIFLGRSFGLNGIVFGYLFLTVFISLPWAYNIFKRKKKEFQNQLTY